MCQIVRTTVTPDLAFIAHREGKYLGAMARQNSLRADPLPTPDIYENGPGQCYSGQTRTNMRKPHWSDRRERDGQKEESTKYRDNSHRLERGWKADAARRTSKKARFCQRSIWCELSDWHYAQPDHVLRSIAMH